MKKIRILVIRNITVEPFITKLSEFLKKKNIKFEFYTSNYDDYVSFFLKKKLFKPDYVFICLNVDGYFESHKVAKKNILLVKNKILTDIKTIKTFSKNSKILYLDFNSANFNKHRLYKHLENYILKILKQFEIFEYIKFKRDINFSKKFWKQFLYPFESKDTELIAIKIRNYLLTQLGRSYKMLILDADNTLWNGVIGEDGFSKINFIKNKFNFIDLHKEIKFLKKNGVILALCTKNNPEDINNFFRFSKKKIGLSLEDFVVIKSNWERKSKNISNIIKTINILPEHTAFLDDSFYEVNEVRSKLPNINILKFVAEKNFINKFQEFFILNEFTRTNEDKNKTRMYKQEFKREIKKNTVSNFDQYLKELKIIIKIKINSMENLDRVSQLTQKVNQFNSTTVRMSKQEVKNFMKDENKYLFQIDAKDIYGEYGIIGLAFVEVKKNNYAEIKNFLFSCRAIGREIEDYFLFHLINFINKKQINKVFLNFKFNEKNKVAKEYFINKRVFKKTNNKLQRFLIKAINFKNAEKKIIKCQIIEKKNKN